jgi:hypothetical protein
VKQTEQIDPNTLFKSNAVRMASTSMGTRGVANQAVTTGASLSRPKTQRKTLEGTQVLNDVS